jgi:hypothetical protein
MVVDHARSKPKEGFSNINDGYTAGGLEPELDVWGWRRHAYIFAFICQYFESYPSSCIWRNTLEETKSPKAASHCFLAFVHSLRVIYVSVQALSRSRTIQCFIR